MLVSIKKSEPPLLPVAWCSWELVFYSLSPPLHHGDSFAAKELLSPLLSPVIIFAHRIQSTAGKIWSLIERFDRCAAVPCDSALIRWRSIAVVPSKIQDFAEFDGPTAGFHLFVKVPDSWPRIKDRLQDPASLRKRVQSSLPMRSSCAHASLSISARDKVCASERAEASAGTYFNVSHLKLSLWL